MANHLLIAIGMPSLLLIFLFLSSCPASSTVPENNLQRCTCGETGNYTANSTYQSNLDVLAKSLPYNATYGNTTSYGFAIGPVSLYSSDDTVHGLGLCRGDINENCCNSCLSTAFQDAQTCCSFAKGATLYYDFCLLSFSDEMDLVYSTSNDQQDELVLYNMQNIPAPTSGQFTALVTQLIRTTVDYASTNSTKYFATSEVEFTEQYPKIYGLVQCTPDLTSAQCLSCLDFIAAGMLQQFSPAYDVSRGARIGVVRCNLRYEVYPFYFGEAILQFVNMGTSSSPELAVLSPAKKGSKSKLWIIGAATAPILLLSTLLLCCMCLKRKSAGGTEMQEQPMNTLTTEEALKLWKIEDSSLELALYDFPQLAVATGNFCAERKLGQGGFGPVYKGIFPDGQEIAVKRLSVHSGQGLVEFKNEIQLIAKLQHTNLVRLTGCCIHGEDMILVYEYLPNKSLDFFIFDKGSGTLLTWKQRLRIIEGVAQGILYLHKHSRLRVIHRDLKASNILLDYNMNPKISDFGLARIFGSNQTEADTKRVVGTYGYMAPEYAYEGHFSVKSDVFSFGVLLLEITSGKRNAGYHLDGKFVNLLGYAWRLWQDGKWSQFIHPALGKTAEVMRCLKVALLCVQENAVDRPTMTEVVAMLGAEIINLPDPKQPAYFNVSIRNGTEMSSNSAVECTINNVTITCPEGR